MDGRVKFEVFGKRGWTVAYCLPEMVAGNVERFISYGIRVRVDGVEQVKQAA